HMSDVGFVFLSEWFGILGLTGTATAVLLRLWFEHDASSEYLSLFGKGNDRFRKEIASVRYQEALQNLYDPKCPYCKNTYESNDRVLWCFKCRAIHHLECWNANSGCAVFGCEGKMATITAVDKITTNGEQFV